MYTVLHGNHQALSPYSAYIQYLLHTAVIFSTTVRILINIY